MNEQLDHDIPRIGDRWMCDGDDGPIYKTVTKVMPPPSRGDDWIICLDYSDPSHIGWWYGQGWQESS